VTGLANGQQVTLRNNGGDEQKRRLLYNAVTRAKERCIVLVQANAHMGPPLCWR
jgi:ATP-dependent exoDNAse (exonuclease V) beta subunit